MNARIPFLVLLTAFLAIPLAHSQDPFSAKPTTDPFGGNSRVEHAADPFGDHSQQRRARAERKLADQSTSEKKGATGSVRPLDPTERIRAALGDETSFQAVDLPLQDAVHSLSELHGIPILVDRRALEEVGLDADTPVNINLRKVSLRSFLRLMLRPLELTYFVHSEVLIVTTKEAAENTLVTEMYKFDSKLVDKSDKIVKAVTTTVTPSVWEESGGPCTLAVVENVLIVSGTEAVHEDVKSFLAKLQRAFEQHPAE